MPCLTDCPEPQRLLQFSLGLVSDSEAESLEEHLRDCPACVTKLQTASAQDTLIDAMRAQTLILEKPAVDGRVQALMQQAKSLYPAPSAAAPVEEKLAFLAAPLEQGDLGRLGHYRIRTVLGIGGMGIVFEAVDTKLQRPVALKVLRPHLAAFAGARERFLQEARAAAALNHENLVPIYEVGEEADLPFFSMQLLHGESLETRRQRECRLPVADIIAIGRQIAAGLATAHARGLVHRDIKPANVWLEAGGQKSEVRSQRSEDSTRLTSDLGPLASDFRVKILDFGLARAVADEVRLTQPGTLLGTPMFMAPEQADGQAIDARADLFSLGSVLYALCTGTEAFEAATTMGVLRAVCDKEPRPIRELNPDVPEWLAEVIAKLHAKKPADRFASAAQFGEALQQQEAKRAGIVSAPRRRIRPAWAAAAALVLACVGLVVAEATGVTGLRNFLASPATLPPGQPVVKDNPQPPPNVAIGEEKKPVVVAAALFPFEERGAGVKDLGAKVTDLLFAKLAARPELFLVDRADLKKTLAEQELNLSGVVRPDQAAQVGQLTGAKLLIMGSVFQADNKTHLVAKVIGTETSRVAAASVEGKSSDELAPLVEQLADKLAATIADRTDTLIAKAVAAKDRIAAVRNQLKNAARTSVWIQVTERHVGAPTLDPAVQTEIMKFCKETGFAVIDTDAGSRGKADVILKGEGFSETTARHGNLVSVKARVELKATDRQTGKVLAVDRQTAVVVDLSEQIAGKAALQEAAALLAERVLPKLVKNAR
jgi:serine/threonine protein kinase/TolB-like protein